MVKGDEPMSDAPGEAKNGVADGARPRVIDSAKPPAHEAAAADLRCAVRELFACLLDGVRGSCGGVRLSGRAPRRSRASMMFAPANVHMIDRRLSVAAMMDRTDDR